MPKHLAEKLKLKQALMGCIKHIWIQPVELRACIALFKYVEGEFTLNQFFYFLIHYFSCKIHTKSICIVNGKYAVLCSDI